jgi:hypothetical protein
MGTAKIIARPIQRILFAVLFALACSALPFINLFPLSTYSFIALGLSLLVTNNLSLGFGKHNSLQWLFLSFYLLQILGFAIHPDHDTAFALEQKAALLFIPILVLSLLRYDATISVKGIQAFIAGNITASLYCLGTAVFQFLNTADTSVFFYHQLSAPLAANAIYVSLYVTISILYIIHYYNKGILNLPKPLLSAALTILLITLMLLSSKMIIVAGSALIVYFLFSISGQRLKWTAFTTTVLCVALLIFTTNPIKTRFKNWDAGKAIEVVNKKDFTNYTFDDVDIRILLAKLGWELTTENRHWIYGNGGKSYHQPLNKKMLSYKLFAGNEVTKDTGYINYNMHNQYLENFMQYGVIGLFILFIILVKVFSTGVRSKSKILELIALLFSFSFLSESVLETQAGILLFTLIVFYEWKSTKLKTP